MTLSNLPEGFYLGKRFDPVQGPVVDQEPYYYDPDDLTTHGVVTGMTGSGKTGLCIAFLEEAALHGLPAIMIDPKGDLTNLLLHFPNLDPADFAPWIQAETARRQGISVEDLAAETAEKWRAGLQEWGIQPERLAQLKSSAQYAVYTPGSDAGLPVSMLASLQAPAIPWEGNREVLRERIAATVTALLGLVGLQDVDPVRSREHILLSNIFEHAWSQQQDLTLEELILQTQQPPFAKLGVFPLDTFFPEKDRLGLAMLLNNFLASPAFQAWREGQPLDAAALLYQPDGRPRHSIFYLAHLGDSERQFFVTLLLASIETWMRTQAGSSTLRAILYFDELVGYLPPISNPPTKPILLRLLKQARAFGLGLLLATQNPVDIDYKALSNAGTWMIGKLQTERDKERLLDGLESSQGGLDRAVFDRIISGLQKRVFLVHNVHAKGPVLVQSRWAMNFLAGPLTRAQIPAVNRLAGVGQQTEPDLPEPLPVGISQSGVPSANPVTTLPMTAAEPAIPNEGSQTKPILPSGVREYFFPQNLTLAEALQAIERNQAVDTRGARLIYRPAIFGQAFVRFLARKYGIDFPQRRTVLVLNPDPRGQIRWDEYPYPVLDPRFVSESPAPNAVFAGLEGLMLKASSMAGLEKDFLDWAYRTSQARARANEPLKVYQDPSGSMANFRDRCAEEARLACDAEVAKIRSRYERKLTTLRERLTREQRELQQDESELSNRKLEEAATHAQTFLGLFGRRRSLSTSISKRRMTDQAKADVEESRQTMADLQAQLADAERAAALEIQAVNQRWSEVATQMTELTLTPMKKDVHVELFGVAWLPYHALQVGQTAVELPAFKVG